MYFFDQTDTLIWATQFESGGTFRNLPIISNTDDHLVIGSLTISFDLLLTTFNPKISTTPTHILPLTLLTLTLGGVLLLEKFRNTKKEK